MLAERVQHIAGPAGGWLGRAQVAAGSAQQPGQVVPQGQGDGGGVGRGSPPRLGAASGSASRTDSRPQADLPGHAQLVQPLAAVALHSGGQDGLLPGAGRDLEALQLLDDREDAQPPFAPGAIRDVLPAQQEPHEVPGGDRLNLAPAPLPGVGVDPCQQPPGAALLSFVPRGEVALDREALRLERRERADDQARRAGRPPAKLGNGGRAAALQVAA